MSSARKVITSTDTFEQARQKLLIALLDKDNCDHLVEDENILKDIMSNRVMTPTEKLNLLKHPPSSATYTPNSEIGFFNMTPASKSVIGLRCRNSYYIPAIKQLQDDGIPAQAIYDLLRLQDDHQRTVSYNLIETNAITDYLNILIKLLEQGISRSAIMELLTQKDYTKTTLESFIQSGYSEHIYLLAKHNLLRDEDCKIINRGYAKKHNYELNRDCESFSYYKSHSLPAYVLSLPEAEKFDVIRDALNPSTTFGKIFHSLKPVLEHFKKESPHKITIDGKLLQGSSALFSSQFKMIEEYLPEEKLNLSNHSL